MRKLQATKLTYFKNVLMAGIIISIIIFFYSSYFNILSYRLVNEISYSIGLAIWLIVAVRSEQAKTLLHGVAGNRISRYGLWVVSSIAIAFLISNPVYLTMSVVNDYAASQPLSYSKVVVQSKARLTAVKHSNIPQLHVTLVDPANVSSGPIDYALSVDRDLAARCAIGDTLRLGMRRGALGFTYVATVEKLQQ